MHEYYYVHVSTVFLIFPSTRLKVELIKDVYDNLKNRIKMMLHLFVSIILTILTIAKTDSIDKSPSIVSSILTFFSPITSLLATKITSSTSITSTTYTINNLRASQKLSETKEEKNNESIIIGEPIVEVIDEVNVIYFLNNSS